LMERRHDRRRTGNRFSTSHNHQLARLERGRRCPARTAAPGSAVSYIPQTTTPGRRADVIAQTV
jgi:hypothetical protein